MAEITLEGGTYTSAIENATELIITGNVTITDWTGITKVTVKNGATITTDNWSNNISLTVDLTDDTRSANGSVPVIDYTGSGAINYGLVNIENGDLAGGYVFDGDLYVNNKVYYAVSSDDTATLTTVTEGETTTTYIDVNGATFATTTTGEAATKFNSAVNTQIIASDSALM